tara:strand:- start:68 stop:265 length:198 start_codon:yes stop_codon:yes gene_type:complete
VLASNLYFRVTVHQNKRIIYESAIFQKVVTNLIDDDDVARFSFDSFSEQQHQQQELSQKQSFSEE